MTTGPRLLPTGLAITAAVLLHPVPLAAQDSTRVVRPRTVYEDLQMFSQVLNQIRVNHPDSLDTHALFMAAVEGMVRAADPHSYVLPAVRLSPGWQESARAGELYPVPISFSYIDDAPIVVSVQPGSDAAKRDILPGDELVAIDGRPVTAESEAELDIVLSGKKGSSVRLDLQRRRRDGSPVTVSRTVRREKLEERSAIGAALMLDVQTGYLRILHFAGEHVADEVRERLRELERSGMERLVIDLRDNSGGMVEQAAWVAGEFLPRGAIVYTSEGRKADVNDTVRAQRSSSSRERQLPLVVLVNDGTASAAELVAGALQDHDRALVVGQTTFGKSLLMRGFPMTDGSIVVLVIGHLKTPCGRVIQRPYHAMRTRDYYRGAGRLESTEGRPSCTTTGGRTVYGGGGVYPDVVLPGAGNTEEPAWISRLMDREIPLRWAGSFLSEIALPEADPAAFAKATLDPEVLASFLAFAAAEGAEVPEGAEVHELLVLELAWARWGPEGFYTVAALHSPSVAAAVAELDSAARLLPER